jgi:hypothetical protein
MGRNDELIETKFTIDESGFTGGLNVEITDKGYITRRKGYNTFGEMVDVLWKINKRARKMGWGSQYTVTLPLKGTKPVYKKTLKGRMT